MPGYVETPGTFRRSRKSMAPLSHTSDEDSSSDLKTKLGLGKELGDSDTNGHANGNGTGHANGNGLANALEKPRRGRPRKSVAPTFEQTADQTVDHKIDTSGHFDFGGSPGTFAMMIGFPLLMWYMWIGATYYDGKLPTRAPGQSYGEFLKSLGRLVYEGAYPHRKAWLMYWSFFITEGLFYIFMPGIWAKGKPLPHLGGKQLDYYCSGMWSFYATIVIALTAHFSGLFPLYTLIDEFGPLMSVAICSGYIVSIVAYFSALYRGAQHRMTGYPVYDFFMGAELNPRMFGILDFKMFFEVRLPWFILFLISLSAAFRQIEQYGYLSAELGFVLMAHFLYANACSKAEQLIVTTW
jgi:delta24(24(1))-sterol reductase